LSISGGLTVTARYGHAHAANPSGQKLLQLAAATRRSDGGSIGWSW